MSTTLLHHAKERWHDYPKPHSKLNTQKENGFSQWYLVVTAVLEEANEYCVLDIAGFTYVMKEKEIKNYVKTGRNIAERLDALFD